MIHSKVSINSNSSELMDVSTSINLFTYNIFEYDLNLVLPVLEDSDADIVVLQEVEYSYDNDVLVDGVKWLAAKLNMSHFSDDGNTDYGGVSILSRWTITKSYSIKLGKIDGYIDRFMIVCLIDSPEGEIVVMGIHLQQPYYPRDRSDQVEKILTEIATDDISSNIVLMGDFNSPDVFFDPAYAKLTKALNDGFVASGGNIYQGNTWPSKNPVLRVDYIFVSDGITIIEGSGGVFGEPDNSDHLGVYVEISIE